MRWRDKFFVDLTLPFGLRSAPYIFNSVAEMVEWILINKYQVSPLVHYLDDFITAGPPGMNQCGQNLSTALQVCTELGLPLHPDKYAGPVSVLIVMGIEIYSLAQVARLPDDKLNALRKLLSSWAYK